MVLTSCPAWVLLIGFRGSHRVRVDQELMIWEWGVAGLKEGIVVHQTVAAMIMMSLQKIHSHGEVIPEMGPKTTPTPDLQMEAGTTRWLGVYVLPHTSRTINIDPSVMEKTCAPHRTSF